MLGEKKIASLWHKWKTTAEICVRDELIVHYLSLVKWVVAKMSVELPGHIKIDDLYSSGVTGLIRAVEKFDPDKKSKFESYAILLIKGSIIDELRELDWIPRSIHQKANLISSAQVSLQQRLGRDPTDQEIATYLEISEEEFSELLSKIRPIVLLPLNGMMGDEEEGISLAELIPDQQCPSSSEVAHKKEFIALLEKAMEQLLEQEKKVLVLYYYEELMLKEIGKLIGVSESRVSQIHTKALLKLRGHLKVSMNDPYSAI